MPSNTAVAHALALIEFHLRSWANLMVHACDWGCPLGGFFTSERSEDPRDVSFRDRGLPTSAVALCRPSKQAQCP
eukprot:4305693-Amphidinium_carterae.1